MKKSYYKGKIAVFACCLLILRSSTVLAAEIVVRVDFGEDNQAPKIGFADGGTWNTIDDDGADPNVDIFVGETTNLLDITGADSGVTISWGSDTNVFAQANNNQDNDDYNGTVFDDGSNGDVAHDILAGRNVDDRFGFTLSGFQSAASLAVQLGASCRSFTPNVADITFNGVFSDGNTSDDFDIYANSQDAGTGNGTILTWTLTGSTSYNFLLTPASGHRGGVNAMILTITLPSGCSTFRFK